MFLFAFFFNLLELRKIRSVLIQLYFKNLTYHVVDVVFVVLVCAVADVVVYYIIIHDYCRATEDRNIMCTDLNEAAKYLVLCSI